MKRTGYTVAEELEEACGEAGCANGNNDGLGGGTGGILRCRDYVYRRYVEERGLWFGGYARHVALLYFMFLCDIVYGVKEDMALLEV